MSNRIGKLTDALVVLLTLGLSVSQYFNIGTLQSLVIFGIIIFFVVLYFSIDYVKEISIRIDKSSERIKDIETKVNYMEKMHELDKRVSVLEKSGRKGQTDPKTLILILIFILLILYLRSIGQL